MRARRRADDRPREAEWEILAALPTIEEQKMVPEGFAAVGVAEGIRWIERPKGNTLLICYSRFVHFRVELERQDDGRWIGTVPNLPGVLAYGKNRGDALAAVEALALRVLADRLENGEVGAEAMSVTFVAA